MDSPNDYKHKSLWANKPFSQIVSAAVRDISEYGFDSISRIETWSSYIRAAATKMLIPEGSLTRSLKVGLTNEYTKLVERGGLRKAHPSVPTYTVERLKPKMRAELDRRIMASASLIKMNRERAIDHTLQRFSGWATSIPPEGVAVEKRSEITRDVKKSVQSATFEERRVIIDQGHKLTSAINNIVATDAGAIAVIWHSHKNEVGYNGRPSHNVKDGKCFALKGSWAVEKGLINKGDGYYEDAEAFGQLPFCRCYGQYIYSINRIPADMLTEKGREMLAEARKALSR